MAIPRDLVEGGTKGKADPSPRIGKADCGRWAEKKGCLDPDSFEAARAKMILKRSGPVRKVRQLQERRRKSLKMEMPRKNFHKVCILGGCMNTAT